MQNPRYDIVVFGATSFVGQILCRALRDEQGRGSGLSWAAAGRSPEKLESLRQALDIPDLPSLRADAADEASLAALCAQARVIVSTVGPYALHGEPLVRAWAESGTDYCDLTGEVQWIRRMIGRYEAAARQSGARIVHCCGFDSIPSDLGVHFLQHEALRRFGQPLTRVKMRVRALRGGISGGTAASLINVIREAAGDPGLRKELANPYLLCPEDDRPATRQPRVGGAAYDADFGAWIAPFVMSAINAPIVLRSSALLGYPWGRAFAYDEAVLAGRGMRGRLNATSLAAGLAAFSVAGAVAPTRWLLEQFLLPAPGTGPGPEAQARGSFDLRFHGTDGDGRSLRARVTGDRDPGYGSTARMLGQAAACLAQDVGTGRPGGFWTPATIFGDRLVERLQQHAGLAFEVLEG